MNQLEVKMSITLNHKFDTLSNLILLINKSWIAFQYSSSLKVEIWINNCRIVQKSQYSSMSFFSSTPHLSKPLSSSTLVRVANFSRITKDLNPYDISFPISVSSRSEWTSGTGIYFFFILGSGGTSGTGYSFLSNLIPAPGPGSSLSWNIQPILFSCFLANHLAAISLSLALRLKVFLFHS